MSPTLLMNVKDNKSLITRQDAHGPHNAHMRPAVCSPPA